MSFPECLIRAEHLCKRFRASARHGSLRDLIAAGLQRRRGAGPAHSGDFQAIDDLSFQVNRGQALGVIGPNGAGKSTLLKIMAGILRPDGGLLEIRGRVAAMIELGAGFHPDLSGRENIHLYAAIVGMSRRELSRRFQEIVEFAEVQDALDEPVKHYSSGMQARLGFAVAAHFDAPVLLVDEVLSVGDRAFRARCLERMNAARAKGTAVVFVSHDLESVRCFCSSALVLVSGRAAFSGSPANAVAYYRDVAAAGARLTTPDGRPAAIVSNLRVGDEFGRCIQTAVPGQKVLFEYEVTLNVELRAPSFGLCLISLPDQSTIYESSSSRMDVTFEPMGCGQVLRVRCAFALNVPAGRYTIGLHLRDRDASRYATEMSRAIGIEVVGDAASGLAYLNPKIEIEPIFAKTTDAKRLTIEDATYSPQTAGSI